MPVLIAPTEESIQNFTRPVIFAAIKQIEQYTGIKAESTPIVFPDEFKRGIQINSSMGLSGDDPLQFQNDNRVVIECQEEYDPDRLFAQSSIAFDNKYFFYDSKLNVMMRPIFSTSDFSINFKFQAASRNEAIRWRDMMAVRLGQGKTATVMKFQYHYLIPKVMLAILQEIHRLRELNEGYGEDLSTYFAANKIPQVKLLSNANGSVTAWAVAWSQAMVNGLFDFDATPEQGDKEDEVNTWTIGFTFKFKIERPVGAVMNYPMVVHNTVLNKKYVNMETAYQKDLLGKYQYTDMSSWYLSHFEPEATNHNTPKNGIVIPEYDDFNMQSVRQNTQPLITAMTTIDVNKPTDLMSLRELGHWALNDILLDFMVGEAPFMTKYLKSIFCIDLYRGNNLLQDTNLKVTPALMIQNLNKMTLRDVLHIRLSIITNLSLLDQAAQDRLRLNPTAAKIIIDLLRPNIPVPVTNGGIIAPSTWGKVVDIINNDPPQDRGLNTVQLFTVVAKRKMKNAIS